MTPNKLPPLPEYDWDKAHEALESMDDYARMDTGVAPHGPYAVLRDLLTKAKGWREDAEALRQSQSLPAGAVAEVLAYLQTFLAQCQREHTARCDQEELSALIAALQADAREKGEAVFRLYPEELARMTHGPSLRAEEEDRLRSIYGDVAIPLYLHSGDYTEAMLLLEKQRELVENLRGQLDDAKADATDGCTEANCERCNTAIHSRGDMRHAGIGTYPATQPAQASEAAIPEGFCLVPKEALLTEARRLRYRATETYGLGPAMTDAGAQMIHTAEALEGFASSGQEKK